MWDVVRSQGECVCVHVVCMFLKVDQVEVRGREVGAKNHVGVLQLSQDPPVELRTDTVELHDVTWVLLDPETVKLLHQVTCHELKKNVICKIQSQCP